jgi:solute:Na+ symporter, SSS family
MKFVVLGAYVLMMVIVIAFTANKNLSLDGFLLGGRKVGSWMSALSYGASYFSAVIIVGYAGSVGWRVGTAAIWCGIGNALIGSLLAWMLLAKPTRVMGERLDVKTLPGFFEKRYNSKILKVIASLIIFIFLIPYSASVYKGLGNMFSIAFGFDYTWTVIGIALLASVYLFAGGYKATAISDFIQGIIMLGGVTAIIILLVRAAGGLTAGLESLGDATIVGGTGLNSLFPKNGADGLWLASNVILTSLGVLGMPQMIHKFFAIKDTASIKRATVISTVFALIVAGGVYFAGSFGRVILEKITSADGTKLIDLVNNGSMSKDMIMPTILSNVDVVKIPEIMLGLFVVVLLSASISTLTALVLSSSSVITLDLIGVIAPKMKKETSVWTMRSLCIVFVILSLVINFLMQKTAIVSLMSLSWGTIAGAFLAPFLYGLLWRGVTKIGAYTGVVCGALIAMLPPLLMGDMSLAPYSGAAAMLAGLIIVPVVSVLTKKASFSAEHIATIFGDKQAA